MTRGSTYLEDGKGVGLMFFVINSWPMTELQYCYEQGLMWIFHMDCKYVDVGYL